MNTDTRMDRVRAMFEEFVTSGTAALLFGAFADDIVWRTTAPVGTPLAERFVGPAAVGEYFRRSAELFTMEHAAVTAQLGDGDRIVVLGSERLCLRRTGRAEDLEWAMVMTFRGDQIAEVLVIEDLSILLDP